MGASNSFKTFQAEYMFSIALPQTEYMFSFLPPTKNGGVVR